MSSRVSVGRKAIFVHVPKNAGTSITKALRRTGEYKPPPYESVDHDVEMRWMDGECRRVIRAIGAGLWNECFTFAFVRNPWDRLVSGWKFTRQQGKHELSFAQFLTDPPSLNTPQEPAALERAISTHWHAMPQSDHLVVDGVLAVDFVGRVETLEEDWQAISARIGCDGALPHANTSDRGEYRSYYTADLRAIIDERLRIDATMFGYTF
jgi:chondroitin 4-sulfotransferase 11